MPDPKYAMPQISDNSETGPAPSYWSVAPTPGGGTCLTYALRGGDRQAALTALGIAFVLGGAYASYRLLAGEDLSIAGALLLLLPAGALLFGVYCLDVTQLARTDHRFSSQGLSVRRHSLFGASRTDIPRRAVAEVVQRYAPPHPDAAQPAHGDWVTFLVCRLEADSDAERSEHAMGGLHTEAEARWLGPLLATWAGVPLRRGFAAGFEETDAAELPDLDGPAG